ncbi:MAG: ABC transporter ATP-binding protein [Chloroflexota bacterium]
MATIELVQVEKKFGDFHAVKPVNLTINDGEFVVLLGPSGCGKTTTLRMIAGLETITSGKILLNGEDITDKPARDRDVSFVFQFFALYPHMTAKGNIIFPLQTQGTSRSEIEQRLNEVVKMLDIQYLLHLRPGALSSGDQQRIALARALIRRPRAFLLDEPLGALDADFRETMRAEIKSLHLRTKATTLYVTHDQIEAMAMGDRIVVMSAAIVQQVGTPAEVYHDPNNMFVARFIGSPGMNLIPGTYSQGSVQLPGNNVCPVPETYRSTLDKYGYDKKVVVGFRPEAVIPSANGVLSSQVYSQDLHGSYTMINLSMNGEIIHGRVERSANYAINDIVRFDIRPDMIRFFDPETESAIKAEVRNV